MTEQAEIIVEFTRGVTEDEARSSVAGVGATVRRRMRADHPDQVILLVRTDPGKLEAMERALRALVTVARVEINERGYEAM